MPTQEHIALDAQDVADILRVSRNTVYNLVKAGALSSYMVGRKMRFTLSDVDAYIAQGHVRGTHQESEGGTATPSGAEAQGFRLVGRDLLADVVANALGRVEPTVCRTYANGHDGLIGMGRGEVDGAVIHLLDRKTGRFNVPFVQRMVPGAPLVVFALGRRPVGFLVRRSNPKKIRTWRDLLRDDVVVASRERGAAARILLDEHKVALGAPASVFAGSVECTSDQAAAAFVAQGNADCAIGSHQMAEQDRRLLFVPQLEEEFAFALLKDTKREDVIASLRSILPSSEFKQEAARATGYDTSRAGEILYEV